MRQIQKGILPIVNSTGLILTGGEQVHFRAPANLMEERVVSRKYHSESSDIDIKALKNGRFKVGKHKGRLADKKGIITVDKGDFYVTSSRLIYKGKKQNFSLPFEQLLGYEVFKTGLNISADQGNTKMLKFTKKMDPDMLELLINVVITR